MDHAHNGFRNVLLPFNAQQHTRRVTSVSHVAVARRSLPKADIAGMVLPPTIHCHDWSGSQVECQPPLDITGGGPNTPRSIFQVGGQ